MGTRAGIRARGSIPCSAPSSCSGRRACCSRRSGRWRCGCRCARCRASGGRRGGRSRSRPRARIAGTFVTAFWLIPELGIEQLFVFGAAAPVRAPPRSSAWRAAGARSSRRGIVLAVGVERATRSRSGSQHIEPLTAASAQNWSPLYRTRGYGYLDARDPGASVETEGLEGAVRRGHPLPPSRGRRRRGQRATSGSTTRCRARCTCDEPFRTRYRYTDFFHLGIAYNPDARARALRRSRRRLVREAALARLSALQIQAVELDPVVVDVAYRYFHLPRDPRLRVEVGDGRRYLARNEQRWDVIVVDAFFADAIPAHLVTQEFLALVRTRLAPGGVVVTNAIGATRGRGLTALPFDLQDLPNGLPVRARPPDDPRRRPGRRAVPEPDPRRRPRRPCRAVASSRDRWAAIRAETPSVPDLRSRSSTGATERSRPRTCRC